MGKKILDSPEMREVLRTMHVSRGMSAAEIARTLGHDNQTVQKRLEEMDIYRNAKDVFSDLPIEHIYERYQEGEPLPALASEYGIHYGSLHRYLKREGYQIDTVGESVSKRARISAMEFVAIWQSSERVADVLEALSKYGYTDDDKALICQRASLYRRKGVPLKKLYASMRLDYGALRDLADLFNF